MINKAAVLGLDAPSIVPNRQAGIMYFSSVIDGICKVLVNNHISNRARLSSNTVGYAQQIHANVVSASVDITVYLLTHWL
jgi:hypothetical protein